MRRREAPGPIDEDPAERLRVETETPRQAEDWLSWELERRLSETKLAYTLGG